MQRNILEYIEHTVQEVPDKTAFADDVTTLTFRQFYDGARAIGSGLAQRGYDREPVLIFMDKSPYAIQAFFGAVYAGCFYVPLDEEMPARRIELIIENIKARVMICDDKNMERVKALSFPGEVFTASELREKEEDAALLEKVRERAIDTDPVYVMFTSGSTGMPKGVVGHHRGVIDYIEQLSDVLELSQDSVFGNQTPLYFDACMKEVYATIKFGATTWLIPKRLFMFPLQLVAYINEHQINTICWVVSALTMISSFGALDEAVPESLHTIAFCGEVFPVRQFNLWRKALPDAKYVNLYGPTETTGVSCYYKVNREFSGDEVIPIGRPFPNTQILLLKEDGTEAGQGEQGEICIRGTGLTHGYYGNLKRTQESFIQNPLNQNYPELIYKTGDIGQKNGNGELIFISRKDYQIKHMGHRIELGEIDANAGLVEGVRQTCCIYYGEDGKIVLFYAGDVDKGTFTAELKKKLPRYMLPNMVIRMEQLPLTPNGKMDRREMEALYVKTRSTGRKKEK